MLVIRAFAGFVLCTIFLFFWSTGAFVLVTRAFAGFVLCTIFLFFSSTGGFVLVTRAFVGFILWSIGDGVNIVFFKPEEIFHYTHTT